MKHFIRKNRTEKHSLLILGALCLLLCAGTAPCSISHSSNYPGTANLPAGNSVPSFNETAEPSSSPYRAPAPSSMAENRSAFSSQNHSHSLGISEAAQAAARKANSEKKEDSDSYSGTTKDSSSTMIVPALESGGSTWSSMDLILGPKNVIARPGSEVILTAGVRDRSGYLRTNQKIDWNISPESVGHFSKIQNHEFTNFFVLDFVKPQILSDTRAVTTTSRSEIILNRGTPTPNDDIAVRRGESWISVTSPREGVTLVSAIAPNIDNPQNKTQTARIIWVDAAVKLPESKVLDFGSTYALTTALRRVSNEQPLERWRVRYEICGNSSAVFADGNKMLEVYSNSRGEARIEMRQTIARQEETTVSIQIIRPEDNDFQQPIIVQDSKLHFRWQPNTVNIVKSMPREAFIGSIVPAMITVTNLTDKPLRNLRVVDLQQPGLILKGAVPEGKAEFDGQEWLIETLDPYSSYSINLNYRVEQPGNYVSYARVQTQKLGNDLKIECSAVLSAGNDTSPYAPQMPKAQINQPEAGTVKISPANDPVSPDADDFSGETKPLPPPELPEHEVYAPLDEKKPAQTDSNTNDSKNTEIPQNDGNSVSESPDSPKSNAESVLKSGAFAPVFPPADPNAQIGLEIKAPASLKTGSEFNVKFILSNRTHLDLHDVGIQVSNSRGIMNKDKLDSYFIERNIRKFKSKDKITIGSSFSAIQPGEQMIEVKLILPNGKEYRQEARLNILEADDSEKTISSPDSQPSNTPAPELDSETKTAPAPELDSEIQTAPAPELDSETKTAPAPELDSEIQTAPAPELDSKIQTAPAPELDSEIQTAPALEDSQVTVGTVIDSGDPENDPSFTISVKESRESIFVGETFTYVLELINTANIPAKQLEILFAVSPENALIQKDSVAGPVQAEVDLKTGFIKYAPIPEIAPGQSITCRVRVNALKAGVFQTHVKLLENGVPKSQKTHETTICMKKTK